MRFPLPIGHAVVSSLLGLVLSLALAEPAASDPPEARLVLHQTDGTTSIFPLHTIRRIDPSPGQVGILLTDGSRHDFPSESIREVIFEPSTTTSVDPAVGQALAALRLLPAFPNPAGRSATLPFVLPRRANITLEVFSVTGQRVRTLVQGELPPGSHSATWNGLDDRGRRARAGVYFYRVRGAGPTRRVTLLP